MKILIEVKDGRLHIPSEYNKAKIKELIKDGVKLFELTPRIRASRKQQGYLEGAVIPAWGHYQYGLDPRKPENAQLARNLFKQDFHYTVIKNRDGNPKKTMKSLKGCHREVLDKYTEWAQENGGVIPNESLYKKYRDEYSMDIRYSNYYDWLNALGLEVDSMPSAETFNNLN